MRTQEYVPAVDFDYQKLVTAFWLGLRSAQPGLRYEIRNSAARYRYGCTAGVACCS